MGEKRVRVAIIGVGHLGQAHARIMATELPGAELVALADLDPDRARQVGERYRVPWRADFRDLPGDPEAVCVVVPTDRHYEVAAHFLERGVHVLVE